MQEGVVAVRSRTRSARTASQSAAMQLFLGPVMDQGERRLSPSRFPGRPAVPAPPASPAARRPSFAAMRSTTLSVNPLARMPRQVPSPAREAPGSKASSSSSAKRREELDREERIAAGLLEHQPRQRADMGRPRAQRIAEQPLHMLERERAEPDLLDLPPRLAHRRQLLAQGVIGADLIVAIGTDQQQVAHLRMDQRDARSDRGSPCPAIADRRGTARADAPAARTRRETAGTPSGSDSGASCGERSGTGGCSPMMRASSGIRSTISWPFGAERFRQGVAPAAELRIALAQQLADEALKGLSQRRIGNVALVLIELAGGKETARRDQHLVQLVDDRGFADAGIARDQHELRRALRRRRDRRRPARVSISRSRP